MRQWCDHGCLEKISHLALREIKGNSWNQWVHELGSNENNPGVRCRVSQDNVTHIMEYRAHYSYCDYAFREAVEHKTGKQLWPSLIGHAKKWVLMKTGGSEKSSSHGNCGINHSIPYVKQNMFQPSTHSTSREYIWTVDRIYSAHFQNVTIVAVGQFIHMTLSVKIETWLELQLSKWESSKSGL